MTKTIILSLATLLVCNYSGTQNTNSTDRVNKNLLYGGIGVGGIYFPAYTYYERQLQKHFLMSKFSSFVTVGKGAAAHWEGSSYYVAAKFGLLLGQQKAKR